MCGRVCFPKQQALMRAEKADRNIFSDWQKKNREIVFVSHTRYRDIKRKSPLSGLFLFFEVWYNDKNRLFCKKKGRK